MKHCARLAFVAAALFSWTASAAAHDVPNDVRIQVFLRPEGQVLRLLVRAPLASMNDIPWPTSGVFLNLADPEMPLALRDGAKDWIADRIDVYEESAGPGVPRLAAVRVSLPSDTSFDSYDGALRSLLGPALPSDTEVVKSQAMVDALLEYPIRSARSRFSIDPHYRLLGLRALTVLRFVTADGAERALEFHDDPGLVRLDPRWFQAVRLFVAEGFRHILSGTDHLLFLFCLVIPFRQFRQLLVVVTAFTVAHSITLFASAYNMGPDAGWFPPLVETLIAASIVYMALENIVAPGLGRRWMIAFGFGLVHGFGFSFALRDTMQLAGSHLLISLLSFNVGVELGQVAVLAVMLPALALLFRFVVAERIGTIILSAIVAHTGWHWMIDRAQLLWRYQFELPELTLGFFAGAMRWMMVVVAVAGAWWLGRTMLKARRPDETAKSEV
jgi:HupE / UreJ protein